MDPLNSDPNKFPPLLAGSRPYIFENFSPFSCLASIFLLMKIFTPLLPLSRPSVRYIIIMPLVQAIIPKWGIMDWHCCCLPALHRTALRWNESRKLGSTFTHSFHCLVISFLLPASQLWRGTLYLHHSGTVDIQMNGELDNFPVNWDQKRPLSDYIAYPNT